MPTNATNDEPYERLAATMVAAWARSAERTPKAKLDAIAGASVAIFPSGPERDVYNNALLDRALGQPAASEAAAEIARIYAAAGVESYAIWVHESERAAIAALAESGLQVDMSTRAMAVSLGEISPAEPEFKVERTGLPEHFRSFDAPENLLAGAEPDDFEVVVSRLGGRAVATGMAFDNDGDRGIFDLGTQPEARRRGLGTAVVTFLLRRAVERGYATASVQASEMAEGLFAALGFTDLGRFIEYVP